MPTIQEQVLTAADELLASAGFPTYTDQLQALQHTRKCLETLVAAIELMDGALIAMTGVPRSKPREDLIWARGLLTSK